MLYFLNDYSTGCAKEILDELVKTNNTYSSGYSTDDYSIEVINYLKNLVADENAEIHFLVGGTQTNLTLISRLSSYEAIIACDTGHISCHETGAIEATGHKVIQVRSSNSKLTAEDIKKVCLEHDSFHMVKPKMVYISNTTEYGLCYSLDELKALRKVCDEYNLYLFIDGARLTQALVETNVTLKDLYNLSDAFYLGGTKNGLLFGECLFIRNKFLGTNFKYSIKQHGGLLAKGRLLGIQFKRFFKDNLYLTLGKQSNKTANLLREVFKKYNIELYLENNTNLIFVYLDDNLASYLSKYVLFEKDIVVNNKQLYRFVTCYNTTKEDIIEFENILKNYKQ